MKSVGGANNQCKTFRKTLISSLTVIVCIAQRSIIKATANAQYCNARASIPTCAKDTSNPPYTINAIIHIK